MFIPVKARWDKSDHILQTTSWNLILATRNYAFKPEKEHQAWEAEMDLKNRSFRIFVLFVILLAGCSGEAPVQPTATVPPPTATTIPTLAPSSTPLPTLIPTPTAIPGSNETVTVGDFQFQITDVKISDTLDISEGSLVMNVKGDLVMGANGWLPKDATPGNKLLMIHTSLQSDNTQSFIDSNLQILEEGSSKDTVVVLTQDQENNVIWVYDVNPSSRYFLFVFPDGASIDLSPLLQFSETAQTQNPIAYQEIKKMYFYDKNGRLDDKQKDDLNWWICDTGCTLEYKYTITEEIQANAYEYFLSDLNSSVYIKIEYQHGSEERIKLAEWTDATKNQDSMEGESFKGKYGDKIVVTIILPPGGSFTLYWGSGGLNSYIGLGETAN